ncbi:MAG: UDP-N-acetylmuramate dehydrogenase [Tissierellia bacterium]|nr:UDP-N-acetylmuramate dehydrogenase [Tissierellia bacterium]
MNLINLDESIGEIRYNEPMSAHTTFKIGGPCDVMILPSTVEQIKNAIVFLNENNMRYMVIGNGSNLLISDAGYRGAIIKLNDNFRDISVDGNRITATSGALVTSVSKFAAKHSLSGLEFAEGIPGAIGGAMMMNAGAYGGEFKDVVESVTAMDRNGNLHTFTGEEMNFRYRGSRVADEDMVVISATMKLEEGNLDEINSKMKEISEKRRSKQPLELPSAGSTFKRPEGYFAGKLIDDSGLRGLQHGGAQVSQKHCGFIVNSNNATSNEVLELIDTVRKTVFDNYGVMLETEVKIIEE